MLASLNFIEKFISLPKKKYEVNVNGHNITKTVHDTTHIAAILTQQGFEVESIRQFGNELDHVVVGRIERFEQHPDANRLNICFVDAGEGKAQLRQIVCGARNVRAGMYVAVALPGAKLPVVSKADPALKSHDDARSDEPVKFEIKSSVIRNVKSDGMLCARSELGLSVNNDVDGDGIWDIGDDAQGGAAPEHLAKNLGYPVFMTLGLEDTLLELSVTPNRSDMLCQQGVARELAAGFAYNQIEFESKSFDFSSKSTICANTILNDAARNAQGTCAGIEFEALNYLQINVFFVLIELTKVQSKTPAWLRNLLEPLNQNSINLIVDISNFILVAYGQPNHAFDLDALYPSEMQLQQGAKSAVYITPSGTQAMSDEAATAFPMGIKKLILRHAHANESFTGLDGKERTLHEADCVVSDSSIPQALLGVVGGIHAKIKDNTRRIVVEFANPNRTAIRHTARRHSKHTVASFMFEKGIDTAARFHAAAEFTGLLSHLMNCNIKYCGSVHSKNLEGNPIVQTEFQKTGIVLHAEDQKKILGADLVSFSTQIKILNALGFETMDPAVKPRDDNAMSLDDSTKPRDDNAMYLDDSAKPQDDKVSNSAIVFVPTWRSVDVVDSADLVEEFIRVVGIDHVPSVPMDICATVNNDDVHLPLLKKICDQTCALGYNEVAGLNFMRADDYEKLNLNSVDALGIPVKILNPVLGDEPFMQTTLIADLLRKVERNLNYGVKDGQIFYSARIFYENKDLEQDIQDQERPFEIQKIAGVCFGQKKSKAWDNSTAQSWNLHDVMMHVTAIAQTLNVKLAFKSMSKNPFEDTLHPKKQVEFFSASDETNLHPIYSSEMSIGWLGELHPKVKRNYGIDSTDIFLFEMDFERLLQAHFCATEMIKKPYSLPRFPLLSRDFSFILPADLSAQKIEHCVQNALSDLFENVLFATLKSVQIFDVYRGENVPGNKKSVTFKVIAEPRQKTFTDNDIQLLSNFVTDAVIKQLDGEQRV